MKYLGLFIFMAWSQVAAAQVEFLPSQQIMMIGKSCQVLEEQAQDILNWNVVMSNQKQLQVPECFCSSKSCQMDVGPISPYFVKQVSNFKTDPITTPYPGPNCFNAALVASSTLNDIRFTHPVEITATLKSSLCKERGINEQAQPGDILVVRDQSNALFEIHAGVYLSETLSFSKYGESNMMPYSYGLNVDKSYGVKNEACRRIQGTPAPGEECYQQPYVNIFSCRPFYNFISEMMNSPEGINEEARKLYAETSSYEMRVSDVAFKGASIKKEKLKEYQSDLQSLYNISVELEKIQSLNAANKTLVIQMKFRLFSLFEQTRRIARGMGDAEMTNAQLPMPKP